MPNTKFESTNMRRYYIISEVREAFGHFHRPNTFIRETCSCDECTEHEEDMQSFDPNDLPLKSIDYYNLDV